MRKTRSFLIVSIAVVVLITAFTLYGAYSGALTSLGDAAGAAVMPVERALSRAEAWIHGIYLRFTGYETLLEENTRLREQLAAANQDVIEAQTLISENETLRELLELRQRRRDLKLLSAEVTGVSGSGYDLDCGSEDGIEPGMCVITTEGMAGYISHAGTTWSVMTAVTGKGFSAGARNSRTREIGAAEFGDNGSEGTVAVSCLLPTSVTVAGDLIVTSGLGGLFPENILIGTVKAVYDAEDGLSRWAEVEPTVDMDRLNRVYIVTDWEATE